MQIGIFGGLAAACYAASALWLGLRLARTGTGGQMPKGPALAIGAGAAILHAAVLRSTLILDAGLNLGFFNALSLTGWLVAMVLLVTAVLRPVENLGIVLLPFAGATALLGIALPSDRLVTGAHGWPLELHIVISMLAAAVLTLAAAQSLLLAIQDRHLRGRRPGGFVLGIPPLITMESLLFQMIAAGFVLLSIALLTGALFLDDIFAQHLVHKTALSIVAWVVFGILLWGRARFGWRGRTAIRWTLGGFVSLALAYFGSKLVLELILGTPL